MWPWAEYENGCNDSFTGGKYSTVVYLMFNCSCTSKAVSFNPHLNCRIMMQNACWGCIIDTVACFFSPKLLYFNDSTGKPSGVWNLMSQGEETVSSAMCFTSGVIYYTDCSSLCCFFSFAEGLFNMIPSKL